MQAECLPLRFGNGMMTERCSLSLGAFHLMSLAMNLTNSFDERLAHVPHKWRGPIVDVVDTFETVQIGLKCAGIDDPFILTEAVRLVFERYDKARTDAKIAD
jgi:hypothetical protein